MYQRLLDLADSVPLQDLELKIKETASKTNMKCYILEYESVGEENIAILSIGSHVVLAEYKSDNEVGTTLESKDLSFSSGSTLNSISCSLLI